MDDESASSKDALRIVHQHTRIDAAPSNTLDDQGNALPDPDAHRAQHEAPLDTVQLVDRGGHQPSTAGPQRMPERDRTDRAAYLQDAQRSIEEFAAAYAGANEQLSVMLIEDDRERGLAQIALERKTAQERLDILAKSGNDIA